MKGERGAMDDLISRKALLAEYDRVHIGEPGKARKLIEDAPAVREWIPVSERLPEHFGTFLVAIDEGHGENRVSVDAADFDPYEKAWKTFNYFYAGFKITHWMPLPEPPKGE